MSIDTIRVVMLMKKTANEMVMFRSARKGYDKTDVNRYIEEMNIRFLTVEEQLKGRIRELETMVSAAPVETVAPVDAEELTAARNKVEALSARVSELEAKLKEAEEAAPRELTYEETESRLGSILLRANLDADRIRNEADEEGKRRIAEAEKNADDIRLDAAVTARLMTERAKRSLSELTEEYVKSISLLSAESTEEYRRLCDELNRSLAAVRVRTEMSLRDETK